MSIDMSRRVWEESNATGTARLVLLALANYANGDGSAWPALSTLARDTRLSVRQVRYLLRQLEEDGEVGTTPAGGPHGANLYLITPGNVLPPPGNVLPRQCTAAPRQSSVVTPGNTASLPRQPIAANPLRTVIDPSEDICAGEDLDDIAAPLPRKRITTSTLEALRHEFFDLDVVEELAKFRNYPRRQPPRDQPLAFRNWLKKAREFQAKPSTNGRRLRPQRHDFSTKEDRDALERLSR